MNGGVVTLTAAPDIQKYRILARFAFLKQILIWGQVAHLESEGEIWMGENEYPISTTSESALSYFRENLTLRNGRGGCRGKGRPDFKQTRVHEFLFRVGNAEGSRMQTSYASACT